MEYEKCTAQGTWIHVCSAKKGEKIIDQMSRSECICCVCVHDLILWAADHYFVVQPFGKCLKISLIWVLNGDIKNKRTHLKIMKFKLGHRMEYSVCLFAGWSFHICIFEYLMMVNKFKHTHTTHAIFWLLFLVCGINFNHCCVCVLFSSI